MELRSRDSSHRHGVQSNAKKEMSIRPGASEEVPSTSRELDTQPFFRKSLQIEDAHTTSLVSTDTRVNARPLTPAGAVEFQRGARGAALPQREPGVHCSVTPASQSLEMSR